MRIPAQRKVNLYLPLPVIGALQAYARSNGVSLTLATTIAVDRFFQLPHLPKLKSLGRCNATMANGQKCMNYKMPGYVGCNVHEAESACVLITFPMALQLRLDQFAAAEDASVNLVVAFAVQETFGIKEKNHACDELPGTLRG